MERLDLHPMVPSELDQFIASILPAYVSERAAADGVSVEEAERFARDQFAALLPDGLLTEGHHFLRIAAGTSRESVGGIWMYADPEAKRAFLYNITVFSEYRRQGYAREALALLEDRARNLGCATLVLNVFSTNVAAMSLYAGLGFHAVSSHMVKSLRRSHEHAGQDRSVD